MTSDVVDDEKGTVVKVVVLDDDLADKDELESKDDEELGAVIRGSGM